jgi:protein-glutamine gamma-glutamyltransferase
MWCSDPAAIQFWALGTGYWLKVNTLTSGSTSSAVERYFEVSLYLLVITGFITLAGTGKLDLVSVVLVGGALLYRGYLLIRREALRIPEEWSDYATLAYVVFYAIDFFLISGNFVYATVHLVLFSMVVKLFSVQRERDHVYLAALSFMMVLAAAVLTVDSIFLLLFCLFLVLATATFISMEIRRSAQLALHAARETAPGKRRLGASLSTIAVLLTLAIALGSVGIFFILPRGSGGYLSNLSQHNELLTGFSNDVQLGQIGEIKQSSAVVMHIQIQGDRRGEHHNLLWRGVGLSIFDGRRWANPPGRMVLPISPDGTFQIARTLQANRNVAQFTGAYKPISYRVLMEPVGTNVVFVTPFINIVSGPYRTLSIDNTGSVTIADDRPTSTYQAVSNLAAPAAETLRAVQPVYPPGVILRYLQLPAVDPRVRQLAAQVTGSATNAYDKAAAIETYLKSTFGYTLQLSKTPPRDPIAEFLFERKEGHCEYFASAMAVMLRSVGIPARLVNGFRSGQFNDVTSSYIIRASDAHTWVEAYFPGNGWVTFDPTPPDPVPNGSSWSRILLYIDAAREFWREWVINYDFAHQFLLHQQVFSQVGQRVAEGRWWLRQAYERMLERARRSTQSVSARDLEIKLGGLVILILAAASARQFLRQWRNWRLRRHPERAPQAAATVWYERMNSYLSRRGFTRSPAHTPAEFVRSIPEDSLRSSVARFTEHYERARFGNHAADAQRLPELYEEIVSK